MMENRRTGFIVFDVEDGSYISKNDSINYDMLDCIPFDSKEECINSLKNKDIFEIDREYRVMEYDIVWNDYLVEVNFELNPDK